MLHRVSALSTTCLFPFPSIPRSCSGAIHPGSRYDTIRCPCLCLCLCCLCTEQELLTTSFRPVAAPTHTQESLTKPNQNNLSELKSFYMCCTMDCQWMFPTEAHSSPLTSGKPSAISSTATAEPITGSGKRGSGGRQLRATISPPC